MSNRNLEFLYEIGSLRYLERGWRQHFGVSMANNLEHAFRVMYLALIIARNEGGANEEKILKMCLVHDIAETRTTDLSYMQKVYVSPDEKKSAHDLFDGTVIEDLNKEILEEYKKRESKEAKIVKDADNLDVDIELKELEERGHQLPGKWRDLRKMVRDKKLYTESAKKLWDDIQESDPASWHITANKWLKIPDAGK